MKIGLSTYVLDYVNEHKGCLAWEVVGLDGVVPWSAYGIFVRALTRLRSEGVVTTLPTPVGPVFYTKDKCGRDAMRNRYPFPLQGGTPS